MRLSLKLKPSGFDELRDDEYAEAEDAKEIGEQLIATIDQHFHLQAATVGYLFRDDELRKHGKVTAAEAILVSRILQSEKRWGRYVRWNLQRQLGTLPDFLILIDRNIWEGMDEAGRKALIDHEISHCIQEEDEFGMPKFNKETGTPVWAIQGHDVEEFGSVIKRNGLYSEELVDFARVIVDKLSE